MSSSDRKLKFERSSAVIDGCRFAGEEGERGREVAPLSVHHSLKSSLTIYMITDNILALFATNESGSLQHWELEFALL